MSIWNSHSRSHHCGYAIFDEASASNTCDGINQPDPEVRCKKLHNLRRVPQRRRHRVLVHVAVRGQRQGRRGVCRAVRNGERDAQHGEEQIGGREQLDRIDERE